MIESIRGVDRYTSGFHPLVPGAIPGGCSTFKGKKMKTMISDTNGYRVIAEIREVQNPDNLVQLRFLTQWTDAKDPLALQKRFEMFLTPEQRQTLKEML